jgi:hypothetical protein
LKKGLAQLLHLGQNEPESQKWQREKPTEKVPNKVSLSTLKKIRNIFRTERVESHGKSLQMRGKNPQKRTLKLVNATG